MVQDLPGDSSWLDQSIFKVPARLTDVAPWQGHISFAFWIVGALRPRLLVELGTHKGDSYSAFCQSVSELGLTTSCYAVDSWQGDEHSGLYGEDVYSELNSYNQRNYGGFSTLLRMMFNEALDYFDDGSIDLLHIDGYHSYEAVAEDFEKWLPRMSARGVVLLHDIAVRERGFGVWKFWGEVETRFPSLSFSHSNGLGLLAVGTEVPSRLVDLLAFHKENPAMVATVFASVGARCQLMATNQSLLADLGRAESVNKDLEAHLSAQNRRAEQLSGDVSKLTDQVVLRDELVAAQERRINEMKVELDLLQRTLANGELSRILSALKNRLMNFK